MSNFKVAKWVPSYVRWYRFAFGPPLTADQLRDSRAPQAISEQRKGQEPDGAGAGQRAAGFIGGYVVEELLKRGYAV